MPEPRRDLHRTATQATSVLLLALGVLMVVSTIARGGGPLAVGVLVGVVFCLAGAGRLYVAGLPGATSRRRGRPRP